MRNFKEVFVKGVTYDNTKSHKKPGLYPLCRTYKPQRGGKMVVLKLSTSLLLFYYITVKGFSVSFKSLLAVMSGILIDYVTFKKKCIIVCCNSKIIIDHSEIDGVDKDNE